MAQIQLKSRAHYESSFELHHSETSGRNPHPSLEHGGWARRCNRGTRFPFQANITNKRRPCHVTCWNTTCNRTPCSGSPSGLNALHFLWLFVLGKKANSVCSRCRKPLLHHQRTLSRICWKERRMRPRCVSHPRRGSSNCLTYGPYSVWKM